MPTKQSWANDTMLLVQWTAPLRYDELRDSFESICQQLSQRDNPVNIVFDITNSGHIPVETPLLAIHSRCFHLPQTHRVFVVGFDDWAQFLARVVARYAGKPITFYATLDAVQTVLQSITDLQEDPHSPLPEPLPEQTSHRKQSHHD